MPLHLSIVADVFRHEGQAKHALEALRQAGFGYDQIGVAMRGHEGIDLQSDLQNLGVPYEQARYYAEEVKAGYTVVSVRPDGRDQEAHEIMLRSGALPEADGTASQTQNIDKQKAAWQQAVASHQAYLAEQMAAKKQEDFHQPRSLKPLGERLPTTTQQVQIEEAVLVVAPPVQDEVTERKVSAAPPVQQDEVTKPKISIAPPVQRDEVTERKASVAPSIQNDVIAEQSPLVEEQKTSDAPVVQNGTVREQSPLAVEEDRKTISSDDEEETTKRLRKSAQESAEVFLLQAQLEKPENRNRGRNRVLLGGLVLGLSTAVLFALLRREQIRQFVLSATRRMNSHK